MVHKSVKDTCNHVLVELADDVNKLSGQPNLNMIFQGLSVIHGLVIPICIALDLVCFSAEPSILHVAEIGLNDAADVGEYGLFEGQKETSLW